MKRCQDEIDALILDEILKLNTISEADQKFSSSGPKKGIPGQSGVQVIIQAQDRIICKWMFSLARKFTSKGYIWWCCTSVADWQCRWNWWFEFTSMSTNEILLYVSKDSIWKFSPIHEWMGVDPVYPTFNNWAPQWRDTPSLKRKNNKITGSIFSF